MSKFLSCFSKEMPSEKKVLKAFVEEYRHEYGAAFYPKKEDKLTIAADFSRLKMGIRPFVKAAIETQLTLIIYTIFSWLYLSILQIYEVPTLFTKMLIGRSAI